MNWHQQSSGVPLNHSGAIQIPQEISWIPSMGPHPPLTQPRAGDTHGMKAQRQLSKVAKLEENGPFVQGTAGGHFRQGDTNSSG